MTTENQEQTVHCGTRERILEVAKTLFVEQGFAAVSVADIGEAAGVLKPSLYYFFKSKAHIYCAIMSGIVNRIVPPAVKRLSGALEEPAGGPEEGRRILRETLGEFVATATRDGTVVQHRDLAVIKSEYPLPEEVEHLVDDIRTAFRDFLAHYGVAEPDIATDVIMSSTHSYIFRKKHDLTTTEPEEFVSYLSGLIMK